MTELPITRLGSFLRERKEFITIDDLSSYKRAKVQWYGKGIILRDEISGSEIKTKKQQVIRSGEFVIAEIDAKEGSFGITPENLEGAIVSSHYFVYEVDQDICFLPYLDWFIRTNNLQTQVTAQGSTNYSAIRSYTALEYKIPLPSIDEQRRIVERLEAFSSNIEESLQLRQQAINKAEKLIISISDELFKQKGNWETAKISDFCESPQYGYTASATTEPIGPKMLRITDIQDGKVNWNTVPFCDCSEPEKYLLQVNDILFARTGATTGKSFLIKDCPVTVFASYLIRLRIRDTVTPDYLYKYFQSPSYWKQVRDEKEGTGQPNVNGKKLSNIKVPIPTPDEQHHIVAYLDDLQSKVDELRRLQSEGERELSALMPSILDRAFKGEL